jgi:WD40 repeat protein
VRRRAVALALALLTGSALAGDALPERALARLRTNRFWHEQPIRALAYSPDGKLIATSEGIFAVGTGSAIHRFAASELAWSADGRSLVTLDGNRIRVVDTATGSRTLDIAAPTQLVALAPRGERIATSDGRILATFDARTGAVLSERELRVDGVGPFTFSPDGTKLALASWHFGLSLFDVASGESQKLAAKDDFTRGLTFSSRGDRLAIASGRNGAVRVLDVSPVSSWSLDLRVRASGSMAFSLDGERLAIAELDDTIGVFAIPSGARLASLAGCAPSRAEGSPLAFSPDGQTVASATGRRLVFWDVAAAGSTYARDPDGTMGEPCFSPDGTRLATLSWNAVHLWRIPAGVLERTFEGEPSAYDAATFSPDGKHLAVAGSRKLEIRDAATGALLAERKAVGWRGDRAGTRTVLIYSPDGATLAWADRRRVTLLDLTWKTQIEIAFDENVRTVAFTPDSKQVVTLTERGTVSFHDVATAKESRSLPGDLRRLDGAALSADGKRLGWWGDTGLRHDLDLAAATDRTTAMRIPVGAVTLAPSGLASAPRGVPFGIDRGLALPAPGITALAFSLDGKVAASADQDGTTTLWDLGR